ncbi:MAG: tetratricopeptide repeat protein [Bacteroidetes bacterium]|nr:tetratricopeptide repeat protein [Bacteroidota bacterium]
MKKKNLYVQSFPVLFLGVFLCGCSIFQPISNVISSGYDNFVAYFNVYYNAKKLFDEAEEEILNDIHRKRGQEETQSSMSKVPPAASQKLTKVIDKCSYILAFHQKSSLVDDVLLLIGKSFYYQSQYERAERKFKELLTQFPESELLSETKVWYARSLKQQGKIIEAIEVGKVFLRAPESKKDRSLYSQINLLLAELYENQKDFRTAIEYFGAVIESATGDDLVYAFMKLGDIAFTEGKYELASQWYRKACDVLKDDFSLLYRNRINTVRSLRNATLYDQALTIVNNALQDFRMKDYRAGLYLERGKTFLALQDTTEAIEDLMLVDTGYVSTPWSPLAAYELGKIYERLRKDFTGALQSYTKATRSSDPWVADSARKKVKTLARYFDVRTQLTKTDSLYFLFTSKPDTVMNDSVALSIAKSNNTVLGMQLDSLHRLRFVAYQELGDLFSSELTILDSAVVYYTKAIDECRDSTFLPRLYYMLAMLAQTGVVTTSKTAQEYYQYIAATFPTSPYAKIARKELGYVMVEHDPAKELYVQAEKFLDSKEYTRAVDLFSTIEREYPLSPLAAKSAFARAWVYETVFQKIDSARFLYRSVRSRYPTTIYAAHVEKMMLDSSEINVQQGDLNRHQKSQLPSSHEEKKLDQEKQRTTNFIEGSQQPEKQESRNRTPVQTPLEDDVENTTVNKEE